MASLVLAGPLFLKSPRCTAADPLDNWHVRQPPVFPTDEGFEGVAYGNGRWVIVGNDGSILSSVDGAEWTAELNPAAPARLDDVVFGGGTFVAVGRSANMLLTSTDGRQWTKQTPKFSGCNEVIHDGTRFVSVLSGGFVFVSTNGIDWTFTHSVPLTYDVGGVAFGNGRYVEAGYKRTGQPPDLFSSPDLSVWTRHDSKLDENLMNVGFGLGLFIAVGQGGALSTSPDGVEWTARNVPHGGFIWDVCEGGQRLVAAAQWGRLLTSQNGTDWVPHETGLTWHLTDVAFGNGTFVAVGWDGQIVQSDPLEVAPPGAAIVLLDPQRSGNQMSFKFVGQVGKTYQVQISSDLKQWQPLTIVNCTQTPMPFSDAITAANRSYRVVLQ